MYSKRTFIVLGIALLLLLHIACVSQGVEYTTYTISGKVSGSWDCWDTMGNSPRPGTITLLPLERTAHFAQVDTPFSFENVPDGDYTLEVFCTDRYQEYSRVPVTVAGKDVYVDLVLPFPGLPQHTPVATLAGHDSFISDLAFSPDGSCLVSVSQDGLLIRWNLATGEQTHAFQIKPVGYDAFLALSPDGTALACGEKDGTVRLWNTAQGEILHTLRGFSGSVEGIAFSPDLTTVAVWGSAASGKIALWNTATGESLYPLDVSQGQQIDSSERKSIAFVQDGTTLISVADIDFENFRKDLKATWWDVATASNFKTLTIPVPNSVMGDLESTAVLSDGTRFAFGFSDHSPDGYARLGIWDVPTDKYVDSIHVTTIKQLGFSPDGRLIASTSLDNTVILWDATTGSPHYVLVSDSESIDRFAWSPDGKLLAAGDGQGRVLVWETPYTID